MQRENILQHVLLFHLEAVSLKKQILIYLDKTWDICTVLPWVEMKKKIIQDS